MGESGEGRARSGGAVGLVEDGGYDLRAVGSRCCCVSRGSGVAGCDPTVPGRGGMRLRNTRQMLGRVLK